MRLEVTFRPIKGRVLPWDYPVHIHKFIYDLLRKQGLEKLHDEGISPPGDGSLRSYGPFTFALVCPQAKGEEEGLIFSKRILLYIATGLEEVSEALFEELSLPIEFQVGSVRCVREGLKELEDVELPDDVILRAKSPICLSTAVDDENGEMRKKYIDPEESKDEFMRVGRENLAWKSKAFGYDVKPEEIEFEPVGEHDSRLMDIGYTKVRGWMGDFKLSAPSEVIDIALNTGIGERLSYGFGFVDPFYGG